MEMIKKINDIDLLNNNKVYSEQEKDVLKNTKIIFNGSNNIVVIEKGAKIINSMLIFNGDNSIVYLSKSTSTYMLECYVNNNSVVYFGRDNFIHTYSPTKRLSLFVSEEQNILIGNDCLLSYGICMRTADPHLIYDCNSKERINLSKSILIGDHVWIGQDALVLKGTLIGSGAIVGANSVISNKKIYSNTVVAGNPIKELKKNVFFLSDNVHRYKKDDTIESMKYERDDYVYEKSSENKDIKNIDSLLKNTRDVSKKLDIININLKSNIEKNRFYLGN